MMLKCTEVAFLQYGFFPLLSSTCSVEGLLCCTILSLVVKYMFC